MHVVTIRNQHRILPKTLMVYQFVDVLFDRAGCENSKSIPVRCAAPVLEYCTVLQKSICYVHPYTLRPDLVVPTILFEGFSSGVFSSFLWRDLGDASVASTAITYRIFRLRLKNSANVAHHCCSSNDTVYVEDETKCIHCPIVGFV
jgi:hypothetical protein